MGWKAAQKLIQHWKILRGDNVILSFPPLHTPPFLSLVARPPLSLSLHFRISSSLRVFCCQVMIIRGKDKGETGLIKRVIRSQNRVIVEGKNLVNLSFTRSLLVI
jgi:large subunit ribosomal protein L24